MYSPQHNISEETETKKLEQSPIDLYIYKCSKTLNEPFQFISFSKEYTPDISNNGHTVSVAFRGESRPRVTGGGLPFPEYAVYNMNFHWESEHTINNVRFPLECQIMLISTEFATLEEAITNQGLAMLSILFKFSDEDHPGIEQILPAVPEIHNCVNIPAWQPYPVVPGLFLPSNTTNYFRYFGSLTCPPYDEGVCVTVFIERCTLTRRQIYYLSDIRDKLHELLVYNYREIQKLGDRILLFNGDPSACPCLKI